jgi:hypothetical protein
MENRAFESNEWIAKGLKTSYKHTWGGQNNGNTKKVGIEFDCDRTAELNIHLEDPVSTKTVQHELHKYKIHGRTAIAKPLITKGNAQMRKRLCHKHKTWTSDNWKRGHDMVR